VFYNNGALTKLVWKKSEVAIPEFTPESDGTGRRVNLVVDVSKVPVATFVSADRS